MIGHLNQLPHNVTILSLLSIILSRSNSQGNFGQSLQPRCFLSTFSHGESLTIRCKYFSLYILTGLCGGFYVRDLHSCWICCAAIASVSMCVSVTGVLVHRKALYISLGGTSQLTTCKLIYNQYLVHVAAINVREIFYLICMEMCLYMCRKAVHIPSIWFWV